VTASIKATSNELIVFAFDPSDSGDQPMGKQRVSSITDPHGDHYTPSSGIWQTVWMEPAPAIAIHRVDFKPSADHVQITVTTSPDAPLRNPLNPTPGVAPSKYANVTIFDSEGNALASALVATGVRSRVVVRGAQLWSPDSPVLYDVQVDLLDLNTTGGFQGRSASFAELVAAAPVLDSILSYTAFRTVSLGADPDKSGVTRPLLNGQVMFMSGWLDQSWWPDGQYTAPTDEALKYDLTSVTRFGLNMVRLHQKVNPQRWYMYADSLGILILQDAVQHFGQGDATNIQRYFYDDFKAMVHDRGSHPSIVQWEIFNEFDCEKFFDKAQALAFARSLDDSRLIDTNSGGPPESDYFMGDVVDIHDYPDPKNPAPTPSQYAMIGEFGGLGWFHTGEEWIEGRCYTYEHAANGTAVTDRYIQMLQTVADERDTVSSIVYT